MRSFKQNGRSTANENGDSAINLGRRSLIAGGSLFSAGLAYGAVDSASRVGDLQPDSMLAPGAPFTGYGSPSPHEANVKRTASLPYEAIAPGSGASRTPLERLNGAITPNGLHFTRNHAGTPDIDPAGHRLMIHGLVKRALRFDMAALDRYPMVSRVCFIECSGNSYANGNMFKAAPQWSVGDIHGLVSNAEWTGIPLSTLLEEAGVGAGAAWVLAEGADGAGLTRSIPLSKCMDDAIVALFQNGERLRPEQGYPLRLVLPGYEGSMGIKWLRRLKLLAKPAETREETSKYTDLLSNGRAAQFTFAMGVKSIITRPSPGLKLSAPGYYEITGLAWSGHGRIAKVEISTDSGQSWVEARLDALDQPMALRRFTAAWHWDGEPATLMSRATDERGNVQPWRQQWLELYGAMQAYHCNAIQSWRVERSGEVSNVFV